MRDLVLEDLLRFAKSAKNQIYLKNIEIKELRDYIKKKESPSRPTKLKIISNYDSIDFVHYYQSLYKKTYNVGLYIRIWANAVKSMEKVIEAFKSENYTNEDIKTFLEWAVGQKTHKGEPMPIGYLDCVINEYWILKNPRYKEVEKSEEKPGKLRKIIDVLNRRFNS